MIPALIAVSVVTSVLGCWPETRDTWRGLRNPGDPRAAKPVVMSWVIWTAILAIGGAAALSTGQLAAAVFTLAQSAQCGVVAVLAMCVPVEQREDPYRVPVGRRRVRLDVLCLPGAVAGLVSLAVLRAPGPAVAVCVATDVLAYVPTVAHSWGFPFSEAWSSYAWYAVSAAAALAAAAHFTVTAVAYPAYLVLAETVTTAVILTRRSVTTPPTGARPLSSGRAQDHSAAAKPPVGQAAVHHDLLVDVGGRARPAALPALLSRLPRTTRRFLR